MAWTSADLNSFGTSRILTTPSAELGIVFGKMLTGIMTKLRYKIKTFPFFTIDASLDNGNYGDQLMRLKMVTDPTIITINNANYKSTQSLEKKAITKDYMALDQMFALGLQIDGSDAHYDANYTAENDVFVQNASDTMASHLESNLMTTLYTNAANGYAATGASGNHRFIGMSDLNILSATIAGSKLSPKDFFGVFSHHDMRYQREEARTDKQPLDKNNYTTISGDTDTVYNAYDLKWVYSGFVPMVHSASPHRNTYHNLLVNPSHITIATKRISPPDTAAYKNGGITIVDIIDKDTGIAMMITHECHHNPLRHEIMLYTLHGVKIWRDEAAYDIESFEAVV